jgi:hypothetical protein
MMMPKSDDGKNGPKNLVSKAQERPCLYYEVGEAGLWLSDQDSDQGPHTDCAALRCLASPGMAATASGSDSWPARQAQHLPAPGLPLPASTRPPTLISSSSGVFHSFSCLHGPQDQHLCIEVALRSCVVALDAVAALNPFAVYALVSLSDAQRVPPSAPGVKGLPSSGAVSLFFRAHAVVQTRDGHCAILPARRATDHRTHLPSEPDRLPPFCCPRAANVGLRS